METPAPYTLAGLTDAETIRTHLDAAQEAIRELEARLRAEVAAFETATGLHVYAVDVRRIDTMNNGRRKTLLGEVRADVRIDIA